MDMRRKVSTGLAYSGALPFWYLALGPKTISGLDTASIFLAYGAIIASFMAGSLWGFAQIRVGDLLIIVTSNLIALVAFATIVTGQFSFATSLQLALFVILLVADYRVKDSNVDRGWYWKLRLRVTILVTIAYLIMIVRYTSGMFD